LTALFIKSTATFNESSCAQNLFCATADCETTLKIQSLVHLFPVSKTFCVIGII